MTQSLIADSMPAAAPLPACSATRTLYHKVYDVIWADFVQTLFKNHPTGDVFGLPRRIGRGADSPFRVIGSGGSPPIGLLTLVLQDAWKMADGSPNRRSNTK